MDAEQIKNLKDEINEVLDHVISDIMKTNNEDAPAFKVGDIVRMIGSRPVLDNADIGVVTYSDSAGRIIYVMCSDGSCSDWESIDWYKVGRINWLPDYMRNIKDILEEY